MWQAGIITNELIGQLQAEPKVIITQAGRSANANTRDRNVPDLNDVANFLECETVNEDHGKSPPNQLGNNSDCFVPLLEETITIKNANKIDVVEEKLGKMFGEDKFAELRRKRMRKKKFRMRRKLLIKLFGDPLDDIGSISAPKRIVQTQRRHTLPVSIVLPNEAFLKPLRIGEKRKSETDASHAKATKLRKMLENIKNPTVATVSAATSFELEKTAALIKAEKVTQNAVPSRHFANDLDTIRNVVATAAVVCEAKTQISAISDIVDLTGDDGVGETCDIKPLQVSEKADAPVRGASMPLLSPASPAEATQAASLPQEASKSNKICQEAKNSSENSNTHSFFSNLQALLSKTLKQAPVEQQKQPTPQLQATLTSILNTAQRQANQVAPQQRPVAPAKEAGKTLSEQQLLRSFHQSKQIVPESLVQGQKQQEAAAAKPQTDKFPQQQLPRSFSLQDQIHSSQQKDQGAFHQSLNSKQILPESLAQGQKQQEAATAKPQTDKLSQQQLPRSFSLQEHVEKMQIVPENSVQGQKQQEAAAATAAKQQTAQLSQQQQQRSLPLQNHALIKQILNSGKQQQSAPSEPTGVQLRPVQPKPVSLQGHDSQFHLRRPQEYQQQPVSQNSSHVSSLNRFVQGSLPPQPFQPQAANAAATELPQMIRIFANTESFQVVSNSVCADTLLPHLWGFSLWSTHVYRFQENVGIFVRDVLFRESSLAFSKYCEQVRASFGRKILRSLLPIDVEQLNIAGIMRILAKKLTEMGLPIGGYAIFTVVSDLIEPCEDICRTPFTKKFYNHVKLNMQRLQIKTRMNTQNAPPITVLQLKQLEMQIKQYWLISNWLQADLNRRNSSSQPQPTKAKKPRKKDASLRQMLQETMTNTILQHQNNSATSNPNQTETVTQTPNAVILNVSVVPPVQCKPTSVPSPTSNPEQSGSCNANAAPEPDESPSQESPTYAEPLPSVRPPEEDPNESTNVDDDVIDLTWIDDGDEKEIVEEIQDCKAFLLKSEANEEVVPSPDARETVSPDSGCGSPRSQNDDSAQEYRCWCGNRAKFICMCQISMYCSRQCQRQDWVDHQNLCKRLQNGAE